MAKIYLTRSFTESGGGAGTTVEFIETTKTKEEIASMANSNLYPALIRIETETDIFEYINRYEIVRVTD